MSDQPDQVTQPVHPEPQHFPEVDGQQAGAASAPVAEAVPVYEPMPHVEHQFSPENFVCVRCGSSNLADGYIVDYGDRFEQIHFAPKRISLRWLNSLLALRPWRSLAKVGAVACRDCGAVLLTVTPEELRHAEHRRDDTTTR
jgi:hypothetical protein